MSWKIESLLRNRTKIRTGVETLAMSSESGPMAEFPDEFNDLILAESAIDRLYKSNVITDDDMIIIDSVSDGSPFPVVARSLGISRQTLVTRFSEICDRIAFYLGGEFTDEGMIASMVTGHNLTPEQEMRLRSYINGRFRHKIKRNRWKT